MLEGQKRSVKGQRITNSTSYQANRYYCGLNCENKAYVAWKQTSCFFISKEGGDAYVGPPLIDGFNIISPPPLLSTVYLVSKARAAREGACIFLPLFPVFPYQSEKVVATPTRKIEIEV